MIPPSLSTPPKLSRDLPVDQVCQIRAGPPAPHPDGWWTWPNVRTAQVMLADRAIHETPSLAPECDGRGVILIGGGPYLPSAYVTARVLRHVGCRLPVELWHLAGEVNGLARRLLEPLGVTCVDADAMARDHPFRFLDGHWWKGWQLKVYALLHCRFREVLLLDADCYPVRDPEFVFDWPGFRERGSVFWTGAAVPIPELSADQWAAFGMPAYDDASNESGQVVLDRRRCWPELWLAAHYNAQADYTYRHVWGDKDTFPLAWRRLGRPYGRMWPWCGCEGPAVLQLDDRGRILFVHRTLEKFTLEGPWLPFRSTPQRQPKNRIHPQLPHEAFCFQVLEEFRLAWVASSKLRESPELSYPWT